jgi:hypothetical protein
LSLQNYIVIWNDCEIALHIPVFVSASLTALCLGLAIMRVRRARRVPLRSRRARHAGFAQWTRGLEVARLSSRRPGSKPKTARSSRPPSGWTNTFAFALLARSSRLEVACQSLNSGRRRTLLRCRSLEEDEHCMTLVTEWQSNE